MRLRSWSETLSAVALFACTAACTSPSLTSVEWSTVNERQPGVVGVRGVGLRPPLELAIGGGSPRPLFISTPTVAERPADSMPEGRYDLALYRDGRVVSRLRDALVVSAHEPTERPSPVNVLQLVVTFRDLDEALSRRLIAAVGVRGPHGVTILKVAAPRTSSQHLSRFDRSGVVWVPLDSSCSAVTVDRLLALPTPLVISADGSRPPRCGSSGFSEIPLERNVLMTLATAAGRLRLAVDEVRSPDAVPAFVARHAAHVYASVSLADSDMRAVLVAGAQVRLAPATVLGAIVTASVFPERLDLTINVACVPEGVSCTAAPNPHFPAVHLMSGATVPVLVGDRTIALRVVDVHAVDEPIVTSRAAAGR